VKAFLLSLLLKSCFLDASHLPLSLEQYNKGMYLFGCQDSLYCFIGCGYGFEEGIETPVCLKERYRKKKNEEEFLETRRRREKDKGNSRDFEERVLTKKRACMTSERSWQHKSCLRGLYFGHTSSCTVA